jgi:hypothetical protein
MHLHADSGGSCPTCGIEKACRSGSDYTTFNCQGGFCAEPVGDTVIAATDLVLCHSNCIVAQQAGSFKLPGLMLAAG